MLRRAQVVGMGLIGGSMSMALRDAGWWVTGDDLDENSTARALDLGAIDAVGRDPRADLTVVATPVKAIVDEVRRALDETDGLVIDVGSVKGAVVEAIDDPRFVGTHPMAGSEREGVDGSDPQIFRNAVWVLTPTPTTSPEAYADVRGIVARLGAEIVSLSATNHDELVAVVSHVPHLTAATLMNLASSRAVDNRVLLRLAAGGFRDMTRIAAGHPGIWPDIVDENRTAILSTLDQLIEGLQHTRSTVASMDRTALVQTLEQARSSRINLPTGVMKRPSELCELQVPIVDRPGSLAEVATLATDLDISILDLEIRHSAEGARGVLHVLVDGDRGDEFRTALAKADMPSTIGRLT